MPSTPRIRCAGSGGCLSIDAQIAFKAVWDPTIDRNQSVPSLGSRAKASAVAEKPPALIVYRVSASIIAVWVAIGVSFPVGIDAADSLVRRGASVDDVTEVLDARVVVAADNDVIQ